jgi:hypothetical protein
MAWRIRRTSMKSQRHSEGNDVKFEYGRPVGARYSIISLSSYELFVRLCGQWCGSSCTASVSRDARLICVGGIRFAGQRLMSQNDRGLFGLAIPAVISSLLARPDSYISLMGEPFWFASGLNFSYVALPRWPLALQGTCRRLVRIFRRAART